MRLFKYFFVKEKLFHFFSCFILTLRKIKKDFIFISWFYVSCEFEHSLKPFIPYYSRKLFCLVNSFLNEKQLRECVHSNHVLIDAPSLIKFYYLDEKVRFYLPLIILRVTLEGPWFAPMEMEIDTWLESWVGALDVHLVFLGCTLKFQIMWTG